MHRSLASAASATGPAACLQSAGCAFRFNGRGFGLRCHDLWSWLDKLAASDCLAGDWLGVLLQLWTQTQEGSSVERRSAPPENRALKAGLGPAGRHEVSPPSTKGARALLALP